MPTLRTFWWTMNTPDETRSLRPTKGILVVVFVAAATILSCGPSEEGASEFETEEEFIGPLIPGRYAVEFSVVESTCTPSLDELTPTIDDWPWPWVGMSLSPFDEYEGSMTISVLRLRQGARDLESFPIPNFREIPVGRVASETFTFNSLMEVAADPECVEKFDANQENTTWTFNALPSGEYEILVSTDYTGIEECPAELRTPWAPDFECEETYSLRLTELVERCPVHMLVDNGSSGVLTPDDFSYPTRDWSRDPCNSPMADGYVPSDYE